MLQLYIEWLFLSLVQHLFNSVYQPRQKVHLKITLISQLLSILHTYSIYILHPLSINLLPTQLFPLTYLATAQISIVNHIPITFLKEIHLTYHPASAQSLAHPTCCQWNCATPNPWAMQIKHMLIYNILFQQFKFVYPFVRFDFSDENHQILNLLKQHPKMVVIDRLELPFHLHQLPEFTSYNIFRMPLLELHCSNHIESTFRSKQHFLYLSNPFLNFKQL